MPPKPRSDCRARDAERNEDCSLVKSPYVDGLSLLYSCQTGVVYLNAISKPCDIVEDEVDGRNVDDLWCSSTRLRRVLRAARREGFGVAIWGCAGWVVLLLAIERKLLVMTRLMARAVGRIVVLMAVMLRYRCRWYRRYNSQMNLKKTCRKIHVNTIDARDRP